MRPITTAMVGREGEQAELGAFVKSGMGRALVLRGEAGVGRSALLGHAAAVAEREGYVVVRAAGVEAESALPYAGLHQLLHPLLAGGGACPDEGARAELDAVFGGTRGDRPSVMALGIAVLRLLSRPFPRRPLLLALDDGQWLDDASADVLGFVGRRLAGSPVKLLAAVRGDIRSRLDTAALPELPVAALADEDAARLLDHAYPDLDRRLRRVVLRQARGNPLALLELPADVGGGGEGGEGGEGGDRLFGQHGVPLSPRLRRLFGARVEALDARVRAELLMGALDGADATPGTRYVMRDADAAVAVGLLDVGVAGGDYVFRHPLVRAAVVRMATPDQRRAARRALERFRRGNCEPGAAHPVAAGPARNGPAAAGPERARPVPRPAGTPPPTPTLTLTPTPTPDPPPLTWQERRIADLAASGLTNKEIGERMHLSPRTVGSHLYRAFPKLGITTRAALRDALSRSEEAARV
ncbi:AAA family ATPase [Streptomyces mobaraensis]|uniref:helix-turn-helix transcriptional regulator n=1 Tax=Streptomyces TaxID=1883 RepID=UPI001CCD79C7|nr:MULTISPECIES: helix-turn-helix transcriptional regulator [Streptomyces]UBI40306.1 AAA family ATPase [Streptomyces mobaraensis]UKW32886.1 AAA family ATPase [Streptomyces sp. TYQ1024]